MLHLVSRVPLLLAKETEACQVHQKYSMVLKIETTLKSKLNIEMLNFYTIFTTLLMMNMTYKRKFDQGQNHGMQ